MTGLLRLLDNDIYNDNGIYDDDDDDDDNDDDDDDTVQLYLANGTLL